jgi:hypothetical protein
MPGFQVYGRSAQADRLLVWRLIRCDAPGLHARSNAGVEIVSSSFHAHREPQLPTRLGPSHDMSFSRSRDGTCLMRLPSVMGGAWAPTAATSLRLTRPVSPPGLYRESAIDRQRYSRNETRGGRA